MGQLDRNGFAVVFRSPEGPEYLRYVRGLHESIAGHDLVEPFAELVALHPVLVGNLRNLLGMHRHEHDFLMQHLVVLEMVQQHWRSAPASRGHEDSSPRHTVRLAPPNVVEKEINGQRVLLSDAGEPYPALLPGGHEQ